MDMGINVSHPDLAANVHGTYAPTGRPLGADAHGSLSGEEPAFPKYTVIIIKSARINLENSQFYSSEYLELEDKLKPMDFWLQTKSYNQPVHLHMNI